MSKPIGYMELCEHLLNQGVMTDVIIKHRWAMQAIAKYSTAMPADVDYDQLGTSLKFVDHGRAIYFYFERLSGKATMTTAYYDPDAGEEYRYDGQRPNDGAIEFAFAWLYTATAQWAWYLRFWVWVKEQFV